MVVGFHIGTDGGDQSGHVPRPRRGDPQLRRDDATAASIAAMKLCPAGALRPAPGPQGAGVRGRRDLGAVHRRPDERGLPPARHVRAPAAVAGSPKEYLYRQVYASFQHDETAPAAMWAMGYHNVMFGSDYPHLEGTYGHTQKTLHELFDDVDAEVRDRITRGTFEELFPHVSAPPS